MAVTTVQKQVNIRIGSALYRALESIAHQERRSVPQAARLLLEEGLRQRIGRGLSDDDTPGSEVVALAVVGGAYREEGRLEERRRLAAIYTTGGPESVQADLGLPTS